MKTARLLLATVAATALSAGAAVAQDSITVVSWGGAYSKSQIEAYHKPFIAKTGVQIRSEDYDGNVAPIKAQVESGTVTWDVVDVELSDAVRMCDEGLIEEIDVSILKPAPDGTPAEDDFLKGTIHDCAVATIIWSNVYAYDDTKFPDAKPTTIADFFDTEKFPGKRGVRKTPKSNLEMALMADGVPADEVYEVLSTPEGIDRALAKFDTIKDDIVWWETGAQPPQLLADGEVSMTTAYNGRIFAAQIAEGKPFTIVWDGQVWDLDLWVVPKGAPNKEKAMEFISFSTETPQLAEQAKWISYGPARKSSISLIGKYEDGKTDMGPHMPTAPENFKKAVQNDFLFWADHAAELDERFNAWLAK